MTYRQVFSYIAVVSTIAVMFVGAVAKWAPKTPRYDTPMAATVAAGLCPAALLFEAQMSSELTYGCTGYTAPAPQDRCEHIAKSAQNIDAMVIALTADPEQTAEHTWAIVTAQYFRSLVEGEHARVCAPLPGRPITI